MDNEATRLINNGQSQKEQNNYQSVPKTTDYKTAQKSGSAPAAAGGFVAGAAVGAGATVAAQNTSDETPVQEDVKEEVSQEAKTPAPEQAILANDEGVRYAHVDADNFSDAFAQARAQVGPGGVFEYNGRLYGTYYAEEWDSMSAQEKADYQNRVNEVAPSHHAVSDNTQSTHVAEHHDITQNVTDTNHDVADANHDVISADTEMISAEPVDNEIHVLGVESVQNEHGQIMNVALVECEGDQALLVDVDNDGAIEVLLHDDNGDGNIEEPEIHDVSEAGIEVADLAEMQAAQEGETLYASCDDTMPDYVNDADSTMFA